MNFKPTDRHYILFSLNILDIDTITPLLIWLFVISVINPSSVIIVVYYTSVTMRVVHITYLSISELFCLESNKNQEGVIWQMLMSLTTDIHPHVCYISNINSCLSCMLYNHMIQIIVLAYIFLIRYNYDGIIYHSCST